MPQIVELPDGNTVQFDDKATPAQMDAAIRSSFPNLFPQQKPVQQEQGMLDKLGGLLGIGQKHSVMDGYAGDAQSGDSGIRMNERGLSTVSDRAQDIMVNNAYGNASGAHSNQDQSAGLARFNDELNNIGSSPRLPAPEQAIANAIEGSDRYISNENRKREEEQAKISALRKQTAEENPYGSDALSGMASISSNLLDIPQFAADAVNTFVANPILHAIGRDGFSPAARFEIAKDLERAASDFASNKGNKKVEDLNFHDTSEVGSWIASNALKQSPQLVMGAAATFIPKMRAAYLSLMGAMSGAGQYQQDLEKGVENKYALIDGAVNGAFEAVGEALGFNAFDKIAPVLKSATMAQKAGIARDMLSRTMMGAAAMVGQMGAEASGEMITQLGQNASQRYIAGDKTTGLGDNVLTAGAIGAIMGTPAGAAHFGHAAMQPTDAAQEFGSALQDSVNNTDFSQGQIEQDALRALSPSQNIQDRIPQIEIERAKLNAMRQKARAETADTEQAAASVMSAPDDVESIISAANSAIEGTGDVWDSHQAREDLIARVEAANPIQDVELETAPVVPGNSEIPTAPAVEAEAIANPHEIEPAMDAAALIGKSYADDSEALKASEILDAAQIPHRIVPGPDNQGYAIEEIKQDKPQEPVNAAEETTQAQPKQAQQQAAPAVVQPVDAARTDSADPAVATGITPAGAGVQEAAGGRTVASAKTGSPMLWQQTRAEYVARQSDNVPPEDKEAAASLAERQHQNAVAFAMRSNKNVPANVLADYPNIAQGAEVNAQRKTESGTQEPQAPVRNEAPQDDVVAVGASVQPAAETPELEIAPEIKAASESAKKSSLVPFSKRVASTDARLQDPAQRATLEGMKSEFGWAEVGGKLIRGQDGEAASRTKWMPIDDRALWQNRPDKNVTEKEAHSLVNDALSGKPLPAKGHRFINYLLDVADDREKQVSGESGIASEIKEAEDALSQEEWEALDERMKEAAKQIGQHEVEAIADHFADTAEIHGVKAWHSAMVSAYDNALRHERIKREQIRQTQPGIEGEGGRSSGEEISTGTSNEALPSSEPAPILQSYTNAEVLAREKARAKAEEEANNEPPTKHVTADQSDLFNTQDSLFNSNREHPESSTAQAGNVKASDDPAKWEYKTAEWKKTGAEKARKVSSINSADIYLERFDKSQQPYGIGQATAVDGSGNVVGTAFYDRRDDGRLEASVEVAPGYRRKGIASAMYDAIESAEKEKLAPSPGHSKDAAAFWASREKNQSAAKKLEVLKAQAQGKISGDQGAALKELADAGEHAAVDEVLRTSPAANLEKAENLKQESEKSAAQFKPVEKSAENVQIDDFGEKLGGARKDLAAAIKQEYSDSDIASLPLSKIWPADLAEKIEDKFVAAFAFAARQEIPAKPRVKYKVDSWVKKVKILRDLAGMMTDSETTRIKAESLLKETKALDGFNAKISLLESIDREQWKRIGKVWEYPNAYSYDADGKQVPAASVLVEIDDKRVRFEGAKSVGEAIDKVKEKLGVAAQGKRMEFEVRGRSDAYFINKKGDPLYRKLKTFTDSKEAIDFKRNNYDELVAAWEAVKDSDNVKEADLRTRENRERTADDWRKGKDVTPEQFISEFGFRGVEFGLWVKHGKNAKERQGMLNAAYDALMDLSNIINVPPKALSLEGTLGLGFGSRGSGAASAHFEPDTLVINLTKTRGAGTLAHEWFHALDNYFQLKRGKPATWQREEGYITYNPENYYVHKRTGFKLPERAFNKMIQGERHPEYGSLYGDGKDRANWELKEGVRPEVGEAFSDLVKELNESPMAKRASLIDKGKSGGYWSRIIERGARSFENYVIHKMMLKGYHNDYLANVTPANEFQRDAGRYPYLLEGEIEPVAEAFDTLFQTIKTKETDKGVALFSRANPQTKLYSQLARQIEAAPDRVFQTGKQVSLWLQSNQAKLGIKKDEIYWSGITDWLNAQGKVTKADVLAYLASNGVQIEEVMLGERYFPKGERERYFDFFKNDNGKWLVYNKTGEVLSGEFDALVDARGWADDRIESEHERLIPNGITGITKFASYVPPGGKPGTYRELLLTLPTYNAKALARRQELAAIDRERPLSDAEQAEYDGLQGKGLSEKSFRSSHFDQPNIIAHLRVDEVEGANGERLLRVVEAQSDWGQEGRKKGFGKNNITTLPNGFYVAREGATYIVRDSRGYNAIGAKNAQTEQLAIDAYLDYKNRAQPMHGGSAGVASAPFVTDTQAWLSLAIKKAISYAAENGMDGIVFATGQQNADLYDLSKRVDEVVYFNNDDGTVDMQVAKDGNVIHTERGADQNKIADTVGKELADKIFNGEGSPSGEGKSLSGLDLKVGGEGMRAFYDKIVPQTADKVLKQIGADAKVETVKINYGGKDTYFSEQGSRVTGNSIEGYTTSDGTKFVSYQDAVSYEKSKSTDKIIDHAGFKITDAMRAKVQTEGLPLFAKRNQSGRGLSVSEVKSIANPIAEKMKNIRTVKVVARQTEIPGLKEQIDSAFSRFQQDRTPENLDKYLAVAKDDIEGAYVNGELYLVASNLGSAERVTEVLRHEVAHLSVEQMLEEVKPGLYDSLLNNVRLLDKAGNKYIRELAAAVDKTQPGLDERTRSAEIIAQIAERGDHETDMPNAVRSLWQRIADGIKAFYKLVFGDELTDQDVRDIVAQSFRWARGEGDAVRVFGGNEHGDSQIGMAFSRSTPSEDLVPPEETKIDTKRREFQDAMLRFKRIQEWLESQGVHISESANVYERENLSKATTANKVEDFRQYEIEPLLQRIAKSGISLADITDYLEAVHIPEANERMRLIHGDKTATANGMTDEEAHAIVDEFQQRKDFPTLKQLADEVRAIGEKTLEMRVGAGLISRKQANAYKGAYENWVPLRGDMDKQGIGKGMSTHTKQKRRFGHEKRDNEYIFENLLIDREKAIHQIEHNKLGMAVVDFLLQAKNDKLGTVSRPEKQSTLRDSSYVVKYQGRVIDSFETSQAAHAFVLNTVNNGASSLLPSGMDAKQFEIEKSYDPHVVMMAKPMLGENEIQVYVNGKAIRIQLNDPLLARAATNGGITQLAGTLYAMRQFNNFLSKAYTAWSPDFLLTNPLRDAYQGAVVLTGKRGAGFAAQSFGNYAWAWKELWLSHKDSRKSAWVTRYRAAGGNTGAAYMSDIERIGADAISSMAEYMRLGDAYKMIYDAEIAKGATPRKAGIIAKAKTGFSRIKRIPVLGHFLHIMERLNGVFENTLRLATFKAAIENGESDQKAAMLAKDLMNFNRKGELSNQMGAFYLFYNPSAQGAHVVGEAIMSAPHKAQARAMLGGLTMLAFLLAEAGRGGGDDDEQKWREIPDSVKSRNLVIKFGDMQVTLPVAYGFGMFHMIGNAMSDMLHGIAKDKIALQLASGLFDNFSVFGNPIVEQKGQVSIRPDQMMPTLAKIISAPATNLNGFGNSIAPEKYRESMPDSQNMSRSLRHSIYADAAQAINLATGGGDSIPGWVDVSPNVLKYWVTTLTGGAGRFLGDVVSDTRGAANGVAPDLDSIPVARRLLRESGVADTRQAFWQVAGKAKMAAEQYKDALRHGNENEAMAIYGDDPALLALSDFATASADMAGALRTQIETIQYGEGTAAEKKLRIKEFENEEQRVYEEFLSAFKQYK